MDGWRVWGRLLWKEFRESGIVLAVGVLLALLLIPYRKHGWVSLVGTIFVGLILVLWATYRAQEAQGRFRMLLPQSPVTRWLTLYLLPLPVPFFFGLCIGLTLNLQFMNDNGSHELFLPATLWFMLALFILSTSLTVIFTAIPAILTGVVLLMCYLSQSLSFPEMIVYFQRVILAMAGAMLLWAGSQWRRRQVAGRVVIGLILGGLALWPGIAEVIDTRRHEPVATDYQSAYNFVIHGKHIGQTFSGADMTLPLDFLPDNHLIVAQQDTGTREVRFWNWDTHTTQAQARELCRVPLAKELLRGVMRAFVRPDGRFAVLLTMSKLGPGYDIWAIDLARGMGTLVLPDVNPRRENLAEDNYLWHIGWTTDDRAILSFTGDPLEIRLATMRGRVLRFAAGRDAR